MTSMMHLDGNELVLKHYCIAGNQPEMKLDRARSTARELNWVFTGGTNLDPAKDPHVHAGKMLLPEDTVQVSSVDRYVASVEAEGGKVLVAKRAIPGVGWHAYCQDTEGNTFGLMEPDPAAK
jgi:hypothetical protein